MAGLVHGGVSSWRAAAIGHATDMAFAASMLGRVVYEQHSASVSARGTRLADVRSKVQSWMADDFSTRLHRCGRKWFRCRKNTKAVELWARAGSPRRESFHPFTSH
jgi:hypothetical protein